MSWNLGFISWGGGKARGVLLLTPLEFILPPLGFGFTETVE